MKSIDIKSLFIGALLTSTIFLGIAATSPNNKWDNRQRWEITSADSSNQQYSPASGYKGEFRIFGQKWDNAAIGAEPFAIQGKNIIFRRLVTGGNTGKATNVGDALGANKPLTALDPRTVLEDMFTKMPVEMRNEMRAQMSELLTSNDLDKLKKELKELEKGIKEMEKEFKGLTEKELKELPAEIESAMKALPSLKELYETRIKELEERK